MGKGARLRRERAAATETTSNRPEPIRVDPPGVARHRRQKQRRAFREFMRLPRDQRRPWEGAEKTTTESTEESTNG